MIRSFPFAETKLIEEGGLDVLLSLFEENSADALKLQVLFFGIEIVYEHRRATLIIHYFQKFKKSTVILTSKGTLHLYFERSEKFWSK